MKRGDKVIYKGMTGRIASLKGSHAVVFIQDTLATITVAIRYLKLKK